MTIETVIMEMLSITLLCISAIGLWCEVYQLKKDIKGLWVEVHRLKKDIKN